MDFTPYTPADWYWSVGNHSGVYYSSKNAAYVASSDTDYNNWTNAGNVARNIQCDGELAHALATVGLTGLPVLNTGAVVWGFCQADDKILAAQAAGCQLTCTSNPALNGIYPLTGGPWQSMSDMQIYINAHNALPNSNQPLPWPCYGSTVTFTSAADFSKVYSALSDYFTLFKNWAVNGGTGPNWGQWTIP